MRRQALALAAFAIAAVARAQEPVRVCAGGDVTLGVNGDTVVRRGKKIPPDTWPAPAVLLAPLAPLFGDAQVVLLNVEGAIGDSAADKCAARSKHCFAIRMPASAAPAIRALNDSAAIVANVANNHAHDAGDAGFALTQQLLGDAGVWITGADSDATLVTTARGDTIAILGFSASPPMDVNDLALVTRLVARAKAMTPRVVVTMHLGAEGPGAQRTLDQSEKYVGEVRGDPVAFARAAVQGGASLVIGHGPHVVRAITWMGDALVFFSLGNLVTAGHFSMSPPNDRGLVGCADVAPNGKVLRAVMRPTRQREPGVVEPDRRARAILLADSLSRLDFRDSLLKVGIEATITPP